MNPDKFVCRASTLLMYMLDYLGEELYWELLVYRIWGLDWTGRSSRNEDWWTGWFLRTFPIPAGVTNLATDELGHVVQQVDRVQSAADHGQDEEGKGRKRPGFI